MPKNIVAKIVQKYYAVLICGFVVLCLALLHNFTQQHLNSDSM